MIDSKLETLIAVSEVGSYTKAAERLSLTQPAVSQHIKALEKELGIKIFNRTENGIKPTPEGIIAIRYAKRIKALYITENQRIADSKRNMESLIVGITHTAESSTVGEALAHYAYKTPGLRITIISDNIKNLYQKLEDYELDLIVVEGRNIDPLYSSLLLDTDSLALVTAPDSPLGKKSMISIDELKHQKMILRGENSATRDLFERALHNNGLFLSDLNVILEVDNIATIKELVMKNIGVSVLARSACLDEERSGKLKLLPIEGLGMIREVNLVYPKDFGHMAILNGIVEAYKEVNVRH
ncbi:MAG: LysR family transcriptional regulator [Bacilli bacterium]|jgi:DNA-binding transcriptional LysR family regulator|nr:LysR family transcriptional regulator [Bacilli bacterium]MCH4229016.1 LysR family transcriptional regulator [Bacilli bacterium]